MQWLKQLRDWTGQKKAVELADDVASSSFETVWQRVYPSVIGMTLDEARGYVRARAAIVVSDKIVLAVAQSSVRSIVRAVWAKALNLNLKSLQIQLGGPTKWSTLMNWERVKTRTQLSQCFSR
ncbi:MAG: hypothetical protein ABGX31_02535 [bacterium]